MGREIRTVPMGWKHPKNQRGHYEPLYDRTFKEAMADHIKELQEWVAEPAKYEVDDMSPPDPSWYRPEWPQDAVMGFCVYETVSEGTPVSPIFATKEDIATWLIGQGYSVKAAKEFIELGFSFSMVMMGGTLMDGITAGEFFTSRKDE